MVRKRSWPAVSQICSLTRLPSSSMVLILKSMPMVVMKEGVNESSLKRSRQHDLPTPESPISRSLICTRRGIVSGLHRSIADERETGEDDGRRRPGKPGSGWLFHVRKHEEEHEATTHRRVGLLARRREVWPPDVCGSFAREDVPRSHNSGCWTWWMMSGGTAGDACCENRKSRIGRVSFMGQLAVRRQGRAKRAFVVINFWSGR